MSCRFVKELPNYENILQENASDISEPCDEYDIKPEIHGNTTIKIEMTDPTQNENAEQLFECPKCPAEFKNEISLKEHMNLIHLEEIKCTFCSKTLNEKNM